LFNTSEAVEALNALYLQHL